MVRLPLRRALNRKMARELWELRGQIASIGLVVAAAVMTLVTMRGTYEALVRGRSDYYCDYRLAHVWSSLERAPESLTAKIVHIPGVSAIETRVASYATLDLPWLDAPGQGLFVSVPAGRRAEVDDVHVRTGRYVRPGRASEVLVSESFFEANGLELGDTIRAVLNGIRREMEIVGSAISPAYSYSAPPGALYPDDERYGVFWMARSVLGPNLDAKDAFNEVTVRLSSEANEVSVIRELDRLLDPYGGLGAYGRADQLSWKILNDELNQNRTTGTIFPAVFLGVAAFLLHLVLARLIATQRTEIGALKALGYTNREIGLHFLGYSVAAVGSGTVIGALGGVWAGRTMVDLYDVYFKFPLLEYRLSWTLVLIGAAVSLVAAVAGGGSAVRRATALPPAQAMRPEAPAHFTPGWLERSRAERLLSIGGRLIVRNIERRPLRAAMSSLGIAFSVAILVIGMFMYGGIERMMDLQFRVAQREDLTVSFARDLGADARLDLARLDGVARVEPYQSVPVRLRSGHRERELTITGLEPGSLLRRIVAQDGRIHPIPLEGLVLSATLAKRLAVERGDMLEVEALAGLRRTVSMVVADVVDDLLGISAYGNVNALRRLTHEGPRASGAFLQVESGRTGKVSAELQEARVVAGVVSPSTMLESFERQLKDSLFIAIAFIVGFASVISMAVIYNGTRIALSERGRELASLRVLGFTRGEVATLLFGEQAIVTVTAIPLGWLMGYGLAYAVVTSMASETYRIPLVVSAPTYLWTGLITVIATAASGLLVRRKLDRMDLITVLKTRE